jgi:H+/Cl- antiporter ClcA
MTMRVFGEILTLLVVVSAIGLAVVSAGVGLDAWWTWCEAMERRATNSVGKQGA